MEVSGETISYRPVSKLAVAAAVLGVLSSLAITTPLLWVLPLAGTAIAVVGLADVTRSGAEKAGRAAALVGLALSMGFGTQAVTGSLVTRSIMERRAQGVTHAWLDALGENRLSVAQSMIAQHLLPPSHGDGRGPGEPDHHEHHAHADSTAASIESLPAVSAILGCGPAAVRDVRSTGRDEETGSDWCVQIRMSPCAGGGALDVHLQLMPVVVNEQKRRVERWTITKIDLGP
jgi:hypothetical protein